MENEEGDENEEDEENGACKYRSICIIDSGASRRRTRNARYLAQTRKFLGAFINFLCH